MSIGSILRERQGKQKMTQTSFAKKLDISPTTLNGYINDHREPDAQMLSRLAKALDTTIDYLVNGDSPPPEPENPYDEKAKAIAHNEDVQLTKEQEKAAARYIRFLVAEDQEL